MNKQELIDSITLKTEVNKVDVAHVVNTLFDIVKEELLSDGELMVKGFGRLYVQATKEKVGRNIKTGQTLVIPAGKKIKFNAFMDAKK